MSPRPSRSPHPRGPLPRLQRGAAAAGALVLALAAPIAAGGAFWGGTASAAQAPTPGRATVADEAFRAGQAAGRLPEDEAARRFAQAFGVTTQQVVDLRDQKLTFSDVAAALAVARASRKPLHTVVALWANERLNWDDLAARLDAPRSRVIRQLRRARRALDAAPAR